MPKTREEKKEIIDQLTEELDEAQFVVISDYKGLSDPQLQELRKKLKEADAKLQVVKNTLLKIALDKVGLEIDEELLSKPLAIAISADITPAKIIDETSQGIESLEILGGIYEDEYRDKEYVEKIAQIPGRDELFVKLVAQLKAPERGLVNVLKGNILKLLYILKEKSEQEE